MLSEGLLLLAFMAGLIAGFVGAVRAVRIGMRSMAEAQSGQLVKDANDTAEIDMLKKAEA